MTTNCSTLKKTVRLAKGWGPLHFPFCIRAPEMTRVKFVCSEISRMTYHGVNGSILGVSAS
jgi:hypothetical protein